MTFEHIVVGYDFSPSAEVALEQAIEVSRSGNATITLLNVFTSNMSLIGGEIGPTVPPYWDASRAEEWRQRQRDLDAVIAKCDKDLDIRASVIAGLPAEGLINTSREMAAQLVVVGTHGRTRTRRFLMGSVAEKVARHANTTLLARPRATGRSRFRRILVACDFSEDAVAAFALTEQLVAPGGRIDVLFCAPTPGWLSTKAAASVRKLVSNQVDPRASTLVENSRVRGLDVSFHQVDATPSNGIQQRLHEVDYDLVAVGARGHSRYSRWLTGSVAEQTVRYAPCSVLVARAKEQPKTS